MTINQIFDSFNNLRVLIVGDVMLDAYVWGKVERISPEAPVPVVNVLRRELRLGGAGNVILNVKALGAEPIACAVVGQDDFGDRLLHLLRDKNLDTSGIVQSASRITTVKERIIAGSQQVVRVDTETDKTISEAEQIQLIERAKALIPSCQVVLFEDYDKGVLCPRVIQEITAFANAQGVPTVVDPKKRNFLEYQHVTLFKPNLKELKEGLKIEFDVQNSDELEATVTQLKATLHAQGIFVTLSEHGVYIDHDGEKHHLKAHKRKIADVSGAGDTVISVAACCVALGLPPQLVAELSNLGGGIVCEDVGVVPIDKARLQTEAEKLF
ncbi:MAG: D-glycero-beta-D-manno-heptose-7-phosphate kinase [Runella slithyformis]|nr:MAG: D-glycero-beta-D-manno-heptose-7-phosphate kinase [Runella slithyformis]TAE98919.1 MAG: D-glycero-beta-D-manno-heptose-7-phosphate kinase [Runella slithyformis]TAF29943.1 MAG: D-glycero-beta-D-manno-heptose-7-phosphate kinase [Runella slithyformis]TAF49059.1 MAG: D-glycero-beta-D-manno-heptose-7-phosphate kinase [Runella slithyformis]TAF79981.1 MAG: D-glycero-beta-D-manno-heptose-7-phosphate kinase [Runella slithyformis]